MVVLACWYLDHMLTQFRKRGYITRYT
jgi:hypothetical protein